LFPEELGIKQRWNDEEEGKMSEFIDFKIEKPPYFEYFIFARDDCFSTTIFPMDFFVLIPWQADPFFDMIEEDYNENDEFQREDFYLNQNKDVVFPFNDQDEAEFYWKRIRFKGRKLVANMKYHPRHLMDIENLYVDESCNFTSRVERKIDFKTNYYGYPVYDDDTVLDLRFICADCATKLEGVGPFKDRIHPTDEKCSACHEVKEVWDPVYWELSSNGMPKIKKL